MTTVFLLSTKIDKKTKKSELIVRFSGGRAVRLRAKTGMLRSPSRMANKDEQKLVTKTKEKIEGLRKHRQSIGHTARIRNLPL